MQNTNNNYILPSNAHIGQVELKISSLEQSLAFYAGLLGLQVLSKDGEQARLSSSSEHELIRLRELPNASRKPPRTTGLYHVAIRLPDRHALGAIFQRLLEQRYPLQGAADHLVSEAIYLADPDGNGLELYTDRPRSEWPEFNGQISMTTDPLDAAGLLSAASPGWSGIHPATDIGHIHLQVSDLEMAEAFYCGLLGFEVTQRSYPGALFISAGGYHHHLGLNTWAGGGASPPPPEAVGLGSFQVAVPEAQERQALVLRLQAAGIPLQQNGNGSYRLNDPDGNSIEI
jgi:catechol 2,3-dioxygenase